MTIDEFHKWLSTCPSKNWQTKGLSLRRGTMTIQFTIDSEEEDDEDE